MSKIIRQILTLSWELKFFWSNLITVVKYLKEGIKIINSLLQRKRYPQRRQRAACYFNRLCHFHSKAAADTFQPSVYKTYREVTFSKEALLAISIYRKEEKEKKTPHARASWDREWSSTFFALAYNRIKGMIKRENEIS